MTNGIDKKALFKLTSEPYLKPISDLGVGFYNLTITLDKEFLQASTSTKVTGQVYIGVNNVDGNPEYNEVAVFREFNFEVADALINKISAFTKIEYIRMFDQLKMRIEQKVRDIEEAIANGADYVAEMKSVLQRGVETLNAIVSDGKTDIQSFITQAKSYLDSTKDSAVNDITTTSNNAKTSITETADGVIKNINNVSNDATEHIDGKVDEFNGLLETDGFVTPEKLGTQLEELEWQKHKITEDDGTTPLISDFDFNNPEEILKYSAGTYYVRKANNHSSNNIIGNYGYLSINTTYAIKNVATLTFIPIGTSVLNTISVYMCKKNGEWGDWIEVTNNQSDTGWIPFTLINGALSNTSYKQAGENGFDCAYRTIKNGTVTKRIVRLNGKKVSHGQVIAQLPSTFCKNDQTFPIRVPVKYSGAFVTIKNNGEINLYIQGDRSDWNENDLFYGEFSWYD